MISKRNYYIISCMSNSKSNLHSLSLVFMTIMLHVLTYVVSNKLFWN